MIVLDASVLLKWFLQEEDQPQALHYRDRHLQGRDIVAVPELAFYEIANILTIQTDLPTSEIEENIHQLWDYGFEVASFVEIPEVIETARRYQVTIYDATYVALAKVLKCSFVTADNRLVKKLHGVHFVHLLSKN